MAFGAVTPGWAQVSGADWRVWTCAGQAAASLSQEHRPCRAGAVACVQHTELCTVHTEKEESLINVCSVLITCCNGNILAILVKIAYNKNEFHLCAFLRLFIYFIFNELHLFGWPWLIRSCRMQVYILWHMICILHYTDQVISRHHRGMWPLTCLEPLQMCVGGMWALVRTLPSCWNNHLPGHCLPRSCLQHFQPWPRGPARPAHPQPRPACLMHLPTFQALYVHVTAPVNPLLLRPCPLAPPLPLGRLRCPPTFSLTH